MILTIALRGHLPKGISGDLIITPYGVNKVLVTTRSNGRDRASIAVDKTEFLKWIKRQAKENK